MSEKPSTVEFSVHLTMAVKVQHEFREFVLQRWRDFRSGKISVHDLPEALPLESLDPDTPDDEVLTYCIGVPCANVLAVNTQTIFSGRGSIPALEVLVASMYLNDPGTAEKSKQGSVLQRRQ